MTIFTKRLPFFLYEAIKLFLKTRLAESLCALSNYIRIKSSLFKIFYTLDNTFNTLFREEETRLTRSDRLQNPASSKCDHRSACRLRLYGSDSKIFLGREDKSLGLAHQPS